MKKPNQHKESRQQALFETGIYLLLLSDDGMETVMLKEAIERLKEVIHTRENTPL